MKLGIKLLCINLVLVSLCDGSDNDRTIKEWKGSYLDKRENWMHGEIHNINNLFIFFEDKECEIVLNNKNKLKCTIVKNVSQEDMPMDKKLKSEFQNMDSILVTHRDKKSNIYKHYFFKDINGDYSFASWYFTSQTNASIKFPLKKIVNNLLKTLKFTDYKIEITYSNPNKPLIQKDFGRLYRTLLKKALKEQKPAFAGKHIIAQWGCDDGTTGGIIDASTGKATEFPFKYYAHNGSKEIIYKLNSSLIIFAGDFEFKDGRKEKNKVLFYEFKNGKFLFLKEKEYKKKNLSIDKGKELLNLADMHFDKYRELSKISDKLFKEGKINPSSIATKANAEQIKAYMLYKKYRQMVLKKHSSLGKILDGRLETLEHEIGNDIEFIKTGIYADVTVYDFLTSRLQKNKKILEAKEFALKEVEK